MTRRECLSLALVPLARPLRTLSIQSQDLPERRNRVVQIVAEFEQQGDHRTATDVDGRSAAWLQAEVARAGPTPALEAFSLSRVDPVTAAIVAANKTFNGIPLFDGSFTGGAGVEGRLGPLAGDAEIGLTSNAPNAGAAGALGDARRANRHKAIVAVTKGQRPGLCPSNADLFLHPFGPPVVQVSSEDSAALEALAWEGARVRVIADVKRTEATAFNVVATIEGGVRSLAPLVVMTPRSGWYSCASERGGGLVCWLELMRALARTKPARDVVFVASSGHEVGYLGISAFIERRPGIVTNATSWIHFGANIGAATPGNSVQASDDSLEEKLIGEMRRAALTVDRRVPRGTVPAGEAGVVHRGGGHYVSLLGQNALFHNPDDRGPQAIDPDRILRFVDAIDALGRELASAGPD